MKVTDIDAFHLQTLPERSLIFSHFNFQTFMILMKNLLNCISFDKEIFKSSDTSIPVSVSATEMNGLWS